MGVRSSFDCFDGEDLVITDTITVDGTASGTPVNITGWSINLVISALRGGAALKTYAATLVTPASGILSATVPSADTAAAGAIGLGDHWYRFERVNSGSDSVLTYGVFSIKAK